MSAPSSLDALTFSVCDCDYTAYYCEENIWKLCERFKAYGCLNDNYYVVFISNDHKTVPLWCQKSAKVTPYVVWDYHVILIQQNATKYLVYDLDSTIDFPCEIHIYWKETMRTDIPLNERYRRWFRVVNALEYLKHFSSDRRHMRNDRNEFVAPPPCWPPIFDENRGHNLDQFISMSEETLAHISNVYDESTLQQRFLCEV